MDTSPVSASVLVGSIFIVVLTVRGLLAPIFDQTTKGAPDGYTRGDRSGLYAAAGAVAVIVPFSAWVAPKLAAIQAENDVIPSTAWTVFTYVLVAVAVLNVVRGLYVKYVWSIPAPYLGASDGAKTAKSIVHTAVGALAGCLAAAMIVV